MKNLVYSLSFVFIILFITSCSDDKDNIQPEIKHNISDPMTILKNEMQIKSIRIDGDNLIEFTYNSEGLLTKVAEKYQYKGDNYEDITLINYDLQYQDNKLVQVLENYASNTKYDNGDEEKHSNTETLSYIYNDQNQLIKIEETDEDGNINYSERKYDSNNHLIHEDFGDGYYDAFEWNKNNVTKEIYHHELNTGGRTKLMQPKYLRKKLSSLRTKDDAVYGEEEMVSFDSKRNPLKFLSFINWDTESFSLSENNVLKISGKSYDDDGQVDYTYSVEYIYEYNSDGYPIKISSNYSDSLDPDESETEVWEITYL
ncbi:MAG: hypothetical protein ACNS62_23000 [Candidatus Cyclobacteriaceae bacterium M3_2C_046]